jgi:gluconolactonase
VNDIELRPVATGLRFPEGPVAVDDGSVLVVEIEGGTLTRVDPAAGTAHPVAVCAAGPNGAAFGPDGAVYVATNGGLAFTDEDGIRFPNNLAEDNDGGRVQRVDPDSGAVETLHSGLGALNDVVFDAAGCCYVVDTSFGTLHYLDPEKGTIGQAASGLEMPNGAGLSPDGSRLYVSETYSGRVLAFDVTGPGTLSGPTELYRAADEQAHGCDGLAVDGAGHICVADLSRSGITVLAPDGTVRLKVTTPLPDPYVTNICFGGADGRTAYICSAGRGILYAARWPWPGLRLNFAR